MEISINKLGGNINAKAHRKVNKFFSGYKIVSFKNGEFSEPLDVRFYATEYTVYCCLWGNLDDIYFSGSGKAEGYGYEKTSAAFISALESAGFNVSGLSSTGENETAIKRLASLMNLETYTIVRIHG